MSKFTLALAGNPNCGKTTLFNALTGARQYVGNWPGVTVEKKEGKLKANSGNDEVIITDLPGIYSLSPYTLEEVVSRDYLLEGTVDAVINIVDATNIERNLYLTTQLKELGVPVVVALNMIDLVKKNGDKIDKKALAEKLGCQVVECSALKGEGIDNLLKTALTAAKAQNSGNVPFKFSNDVETALAKITSTLPTDTEEKLKRYYAVKLFERDSKVLEKMVLAPEAEAAITAIEEARDDDSESIMTDERYTLIEKIVAKTVRKSSAKMSTSDKIDKVVTNRFLGLPIFIAVMFVVYYISVYSVGTIVTDFTNDTLFGSWIQPFFENIMVAANCSDWLISLVVDGIVGGLGAVIGFAPQMAILFVFLSILEDCGYMVRIAFVMDRIFRNFGLSGKSFIPLLIGSGCGVPGIMASKTIETDNDRRLTIMTTTFIPCGAKLPVIALFGGILVGGAWWVAPSMYFMGIIAVLVSAVMLKKTKPFSGEPAPFVMELPSYHVPSGKGVLLHVWERLKAFLIKAGTILFLACVVMWFLSGFGFEDGHFGMVGEENCLLSIIGGAIAVLFKPLGFDSWQAIAAALSGFVAKESIVSTLGVVAGMGQAFDPDVIDASLMSHVAVMFPSTLAAFSFLIFNLLDSPCLAAISVMSRELNSKKWFWFAIAYQNIFAYCVALMIYQFGTLFTTGSFTVGTVAAIIILIAMLFMLFRKDQYKNKKTPGKQSVSIGA